jgi:hypothetical protein
MTLAIAWVFRIRIAPLRIVLVARVERVVRRHSAEEMDFAVEQPLAAEKDLEAVKLLVEVKQVVELKQVAEVKRDVRSLQLTAAVTAPSAEFRMAAQPGCKAITDSPAWDTPALVVEAAVDSEAVEAALAAVVHAVAVEAGDKHDHENIHDRDLRAGKQCVGAGAR